jgi:hypothetical protein
VAAAAEAVADAARSGVDHVLLLGRLAAMPLLTELVAERFEAPLTVLAGDGDAVASGAARLARTVHDRPTGTPGPTPPARAERGRRAHARHSRRNPTRVAALLGTGVIALGMAALAVSGAALASPGDAEERPAPTVSPDPVHAHVLQEPHGLSGVGPSGAAVLGRPSLATGPASLPPAAGEASDVLAHPAAPLTGGQASAG